MWNTLKSTITMAAQNFILKNFQSYFGKSLLNINYYPKLNIV